MHAGFFGVGRIVPHARLKRTKRALRRHADYNERFAPTGLTAAPGMSSAKSSMRRDGRREAERGADALRHPPRFVAIRIRADVDAEQPVRLADFALHLRRRELRLHV